MHLPRYNQQTKLPIHLKTIDAGRPGFEIKPIHLQHKHSNKQIYWLEITIKYLAFLNHPYKKNSNQKYRPVYWPQIIFPDRSAPQKFYNGILNPNHNSQL